MPKWKNKDWLSTGQVADIIHVSIQTVIRMCDRGQIKCVKIDAGKGGHRAITRDELKNYLSRYPDLRQYAKEF